MADITYFSHGRKILLDYYYLILHVDSSVTLIIRNSIKSFQPNLQNNYTVGIIFLFLYLANNVKIDGPGFVLFFQDHNKLRFDNKLWITLSSVNLKSRYSSTKYQFKVMSMSVQQAVRSKIPVQPLELENANEPPLNLYKPKEPYTATIVSVERLVGPKAPGETCHIVIDHGGNVPYWEGQSYGIIPPVSTYFLLPASKTSLNSSFD